MDSKKPKKSIESPALRPNLHDYDHQQDGLGRGAHGFVFRSKYNDEHVAIKVFTGEHRDKWEKELVFLNFLCHPHVVRYRGYGSDVVKNKQFYYLVLELGQLSLRQLLDDKDKEIPWSTRISIALGIAEGLQYLHSSRPPIFHRDLKAANISLRPNLTPFLIDFSLSKRFEIEEVKPREEKIYQTKDHLSHALNSTICPGEHISQTLSTKECGTRGFMAPEMLSKRKGKTSLASDIYSLGMIYYEILTRSSPPLRGIPNIPTEDENPEVKGCPREYLQLMESCWREKPSDRPKLETIIDTLRIINEEAYHCQVAEAFDVINFPYTTRKLIIEYTKYSFHSMKPRDVPPVDTKEIYFRDIYLLSCVSDKNSIERKHPLPGE